MRVTLDTNVLVRLAIADDPGQTLRAAALLREAEFVAIPLPVLCEFVWVTTRVYRRPTNDVSEAMKQLLANPSVHVDRPAVEAGLAMFDAGGDFADGAIAFAGRQMGGTVFASFDQEAVALVRAAGGEARLLDA